MLPAPEAKHRVRLKACRKLRNDLFASSRRDQKELDFRIHVKVAIHNLLLQHKVEPCKSSLAQLRQERRAKLPLAAPLLRNTESMSSEICRASACLKKRAFEAQVNCLLFPKGLRKAHFAPAGDCKQDGYHHRAETAAQADIAVLKLTKSASPAQTDGFHWTRPFLEGTRACSAKEEMLKKDL